MLCNNVVLEKMGVIVAKLDGVIVKLDGVIMMFNSHSTRLSATIWPTLQPHKYGRQKPIVGERLCMPDLHCRLAPVIATNSLYLSIFKLSQMSQGLFDEPRNTPVLALFDWFDRGVG